MSAEPVHSSVGQGQTLNRRFKRATRWSSVASFAVAAIFVGVAARYAVYAAAISDASGYISEASRWLGSDLFGVQPFAFWPAWPLDLSLPLGYRAGPTAGTDVFVYPPGLPLVMAAAMAFGGELAAHLVPPLCGGLLVWSAGDLAARLAGARARMLTAALVATSAIALTMAIQPMSDLPAAAWWMLALAFAARAHRSSQLAAGLCISMAVLTRPNLAPLALAPAVLAFSSSSKHRVAHLAILACASAPGFGILLWMQAVLYGHPLASGYGAIGTLFATTHVRANLAHYVTWYAQAHTPLVLLAALAPVVFRRRAGADVEAGASPQVIVWALLGTIAVVYGSYLFYFPFDDWAYLRFMLPALGPLYALTAAVLCRGFDRLPSSLATPAFAVVLLITAGLQAKQAYARDITEAWKLTERVPASGYYLDASLPPNAVVITFFHSGSIRHYTKRQILRPDVIAPDAFDSTIARLERSGYRPYLLVDEQLERAALLARFASSGRISHLD